jgi:hypothetical protein
MSTFGAIVIALDREFVHEPPRGVNGFGTHQ